MGSIARQDHRRRELLLTLGVALVVHASLAAGQGVSATITGSVGVTASALDGLVGGSMHLLGLAGIWLGTRPADPRHPYGYARYETLASMFIGMLLLVTVAIVVRGSIDRLANPEAVSAPLLGVAVMLGSGGASFGLHRFLRSRGARLHSAVISSESTHAWADAAADASIVVGIAASGIGLERIDPIVGLGVAALIGWRAFSIVRGAADVLTDAAMVDPDEITRVACSVPGVVGCHAVRSRGVGGRLQVDLHIGVAPELTVREAHDIAEQVEKAVEESVSEVAEVLVHVGVGRHE
jgi:cation diffusion facilitator family transporter